MKTSVIFLVTAGVFLLFDGLQAQGYYCKPTICTMIYAPVCAFNLYTGKQQTFGSACVLKGAQCKNPGLFYLYNGECITLMDILNWLLGKGGNKVNPPVGPVPEPPQQGAEAPQQGAEAPQQGAEAPQPGAEAPQPGAEAPQQGAEAPQQGTEAQ